ncbi:MAG: hypothetical protein BA864_03570 [Desulfuromonadales bacterium C00003093]|nr:MAG: hypothetical protein BA864_03570 [Desulfuromonadales bacterium C00003093]
MFYLLKISATLSIQKEGHIPNILTQNGQLIPLTQHVGNLTSFLIEKIKMANKKMELTTKADPILGEFKELGGFCVSSFSTLGAIGGSMNNYKFTLIGLALSVIIFLSTIVRECKN